MTGWIPEACTLPTEAQPLRVAQFDALFASALTEVDRPEPGCLRLHLTAGEEIAAHTRELIARESRCCSFFTFDLMTRDDELQVDVRVPAAQIAVLDGIERRARAGLRPAS